jgi:predicted Ser/Thr protein kinase
MTPTILTELSGRWQPKMVLKRDTFSIIERGQFPGPDGPVDAVLRRIDEVAWWARPIARHFLKREARALAVAGPLGVGPILLHAGSACLIRGFIHGVAMHVAKPVGDIGYFRAAKSALHALHRAGVCHNDLAKEPNWLRGPRGEAYMTDFQLAARWRRNSRLFRIAAYEDLRHLLKHKRRYAPEALTATERRVIARKSLFSRVWMATGKRIYTRITRGLKIEDREGGGTRASRDIPAVLAQVRQHPQVRDATIVPLPQPSGAVWLYAFVEAQGVDEAALHAHLDQTIGADAAPEFIQAVDALPRRPDGAIRSDILHLIPHNQIEDLDRMQLDPTNRRLVAALLSNSKEYGYGPRHSKDAPAIAACLKCYPRVRDAVVLSFPHQRLFTGLYAFVEADGVAETELAEFVATNTGRKPPELLQIVQALPRDRHGAIRTDLLKDIALNQLDRIGELRLPDAERNIISDILAGRKIVHDL